MDLPTFFLRLHTTVHAQDVAEGQTPTVERWLGGLSDEQMRARPGPGMNSIVWLLWHMARTEDAAVNLVVHAGRQVLDDAWARRMGIDHRDIGTGMTEDEVAALTAHADVPAVWAYRSAVGIRTRAVVRELSPGAWDETIGAEDIVRAARAGAFRQDVSALVAAGRHPWQGHTRADQLGSSAIRHNSGHIGEAVTIRSLGGFGLGI
jgi:hypothetical protein